MILEALETGYIEGQGPYYKQPRTAIRPRPQHSFKGRISSVAMSPDSLQQAARLGVRMVIFSQQPWEEQRPAFDTYRTQFQAHHGGESPPAPMVCDFTFCDSDRDRAETMAREHITGYLASVLHHYELTSDHYKLTRGYEAYGNNVDAIRAIGLEKMAERYLTVQVWGTPDQILRRLEERRDIVGDFDLTLCFRYAGLSYEEAAASLRLFGEEVLPVLHSWEPVATVA